MIKLNSVKIAFKKKVRGVKGQSVKVKAKKRRGNKGSKKRSIKIRKTPKLKLRKVKKKLLSLTIDFYKREAGQIISVKDGVARVNGLFGVLSGEMVFMGLFKIQVMVLSLERNTVSVVIFGNDIILKQGD